MIKCTEQYNNNCLACGVTPSKLIRVGAYYMCPRCFKGNFGEGVKEIESTSILGKIYYEWLKKYNEEIK